jgi:mannose/fructose/N-acetylgalactosamine-specific phosphotransferase system component IIB
MFNWGGKVSRRRISKAISLDQETLEILKKLRERGYNVSALIRKLIKEFYEREVEKK